MDTEPLDPRISIAPYAASYWRALWRLRLCQLAEAGTVLPDEAIPEQPEDVGRDDYEWDYHHIAEVYLRGAGGFWLAFWGDAGFATLALAGHIGGQDVGGAIELRRMYVRAEFRRNGIGAGLVHALLDHCRARGARAVELWTGAEGSGRRLYERLGFRVTRGPGKEFTDLQYRLNYIQGEDEIRMRLELGGG